MLGEELRKNADAPVPEEPIEGQAAAAAAPEGEVGVAAPVGGGQAGAGAAEGQAGAAAEGGQVGADGDDEDGDALDFDGVGPPERKSERPLQFLFASLLRKAATWVRGFVNSFLRVLLPCLQPSGNHDTALEL